MEATTSIPDDHLLTRKEVAAIFGIKPMSIWHWEKRGTLKPFLYVNGRPRYTVADVQKVATDRQTVNFNPKNKGNAAAKH
jgi:predicted site-specific integrase-resolvase